jgi:putative ABC transport system permease protein
MASRQRAEATPAASVSLWILALRNLLSRPTRTALAVTGLSIPVLGVLGLFSLSEGIRNLVGNTLSQVNGILVVRQNAPTDLFSELPAALADPLRKVPGVGAVSPQIWKLAPAVEGRSLFVRTAAGALRHSSVQGAGPLLNLLQIEGVDCSELARRRFDVYERRMVPQNRGGGRFIDRTDRNARNIVISRKIARDHPVAAGRPRQVGDNLRVGKETFTIVGIYETGSMLLDDTIIMEITTARSLLSVPQETVSCFMVEPKVEAKTEAVARAIERAIPGVDARTMSQFQRGAGMLLGTLKKLLLLVISLALLVGSVGILNTMLMTTSERLTEFGILRSCGWSRGDLLRLVLAESICLGLLAGLVGCLLAVAAVMLVNPCLEGGIELVMTPTLLGLGLLLAAALGSLGGLYPAWRVSRLAPMEIIRTGSR